MIFMAAITLSSEASEPLGMRGPEKRPLELQWLYLTPPPIFGQPINNFNTFSWCVRKKERKLY